MDRTIYKFLKFVKVARKLSWKHLVIGTYSQTASWKNSTSTGQFPQQNKSKRQRLTGEKGRSFNARYIYIYMYIWTKELTVILELPVIVLWVSLNLRQGTGSLLDAVPVRVSWFPLVLPQQQFAMLTNSFECSPQLVQESQNCCLCFYMFIPWFLFGLLIWQFLRLKFLRVLSWILFPFYLLLVSSHAFVALIPYLFSLTQTSGSQCYYASILGFILKQKSRIHYVP